MADYFISHDKLMAALCDGCEFEGKCDPAQVTCVERNLINSIPVADVIERKRGEWELDRRGVVCTCCNKLIHIPSHILELNTLEMWWMDYCPNCGAWMRDEKDE